MLRKRPLSWLIRYGVSAVADMKSVHGSVRAGNLAISQRLFPIERGGFKPELSNYLIV